VLETMTVVQQGSAPQESPSRRANPVRDEPTVSSTHERETAADVAITGRRETELERYDRNLSELMGELRVALPGVQVLFAFLLVALFKQRFGGVSHFERRLYLATLLCTLLASILLIAPTSHFAHDAPHGLATTRQGDGHDRRRARSQDE
jgi:hypothetical protein